MKRAKLNLAQYGISAERGFLGDFLPLPQLQGPFEPWEKILASLPNLLQNKTLRKEIEALPDMEFNDDTLKNIQEWKRAAVLLSFLAQAYLLMEDKPPEKLPKKLAKPWVAVSERLGLKPFVSYAILILYNFRMSDELKPLKMENITTQNTFTGLDDESWFYIVHMAAEIAAAPGLNAISCAYHHMECKDCDGVRKCLEEVSKSLEKMIQESSQLFKKENGTLRCDPDVFYNKIRLFCSGHPNGIIYEGTGDPLPRHYNGASGAQTSSIYAFDIFLGVQHSGEESEFIKKMREYMPREHREFLNKLDTMPSVRQFCKDSNDGALIRSYNTAVESILNFRTFHLKKLIGEFIFGPKLREEKRKQVPQAERPSQEEEKGTGGTKLSTFLQKIVAETKELMIG